MEPARRELEPSLAPPFCGCAKRGPLWLGKYDLGEPRGPEQDGSGEFGLANLLAAGNGIFQHKSVLTILRFVSRPCS